MLKNKDGDVTSTLIFARHTHIEIRLQTVDDFKRSRQEHLLLIFIFHLAPGSSRSVERASFHVQFCSVTHRQTDRHTDRYTDTIRWKPVRTQQGTRFGATRDKTSLIVGARCSIRASFVLEQYFRVSRQ